MGVISFIVVSASGKFILLTMVITRVGNETNPFVENADVSVHEDCNEELEFNERLVLISKSKV